MVHSLFLLLHEEIELGLARRKLRLDIKDYFVVVEEGEFRIRGVDSKHVLASGVLLRVDVLYQLELLNLAMTLYVN